MQKDRTIQFWDEYHTDHDQKEWISQPDEELLAMICKHIDIKPSRVDDVVIESSNGNDSDDNDVSTIQPIREQQQQYVFRILEIGCGTSTLVRDLKIYIEERQQYLSKHQVIACGTDVSQVCVDTCIQRDNDWIIKSNGTLQYKVLNVLNNNDNDDNDDEKLHYYDGDRIYNQQQTWDLIIDKGCLDTFLFRTRQRGERGVYPESLRRVLHNIHTWMRSGPSSRYMLISPRSKLRPVRDFVGFESVNRYPLPRDTIQAAEIIRGGGRGTNNNSNNNKHKNINNSTDDDDEGRNHQINNTINNKPHGYLYVCSKNEEYVANGKSCEAFRTDHRDLPDEHSQCDGCQTTFFDFRHGEAVEGRGLVFWTREFKNHCIHCKG